MQKVPARQTMRPPQVHNLLAQLHALSIEVHRSAILLSSTREAVFSARRVFHCMFETLNGTTAVIQILWHGQELPIH